MAVAWMDLAPTETVGQGEEIGLEIDGLAVCTDGDQWMALAPQYDISALGQSPEQALIHMVEAIRDSYRFCIERGLPFEETPVPELELRDFLVSHQGPVYLRSLRV